MAIAAALAGFAGGFASSAGMELLGGAQRAISYAGNRLNPNASLGFETYAMLYLNGMISGQVYADNLLDLGFEVSENDSHVNQLFRPDDRGRLQVNRRLYSNAMYLAEKAIAISKPRLATEEILTLYNRGLLSIGAAKFGLELNYGGEQEIANAIFTLRDQIPGPQDLIQFAVKDCFSPDIVSTFQYNKELPSAIIPWMDKQGMGGEINVDLPPGSTNTEGIETRTKAKWSDLYWWSHWQLPSVGQGYEMLQRLYSDSLYGPSPLANADTFFPVSSLELLQKANDFPIYWRKRLQAIAYTPLGRIDIKRLYASGILKEDANNHDVFHSYRAIGYDDVNAKRLTDYVVKKARPNIVDLTEKQIDRLYKQGSLAEDDAIAALVKLDFLQREAMAHVGNLKLELQSDTVDFKLKYVRSAFLSADISEDDVRGYFLGMGLQLEAQERNLSKWRMQLEVTYKHVTLDKAITLFKKGYITADQLRNKLRNLRYPPQEREILITEASNDVAIRATEQGQKIAEQIEKANAKAQQQTAKVAKEQAKERAATQSRLEKEHALLLAKDKAAFSEKNIVAFYKAKVVNKQEIENILLAKGWFPDTIKTWMDTFTPFKEDGTPDDTKKANSRRTSPILKAIGEGASGLQGNVQTSRNLPRPLP